MKHLLIAVILSGATVCAQEPAPTSVPAPQPAPPAPETAATPLPPAPPAPGEPSTSAPAPSKPAVSPIAIEIDLTAQKAWVLQDGQRVYETSISSGRSSFETPPGSFTVVQKDEDHKSTLYGKILDAKGRVLVSDADCDTPVPAGAKFHPAPMKYFLRINGAVGMHAGRIPG